MMFFFHRFLEEWICFFCEGELRDETVAGAKDTEHTISQIESQKKIQTEILKKYGLYVIFSRITKNVKRQIGSKTFFHLCTKFQV